MIIYHFIKYLIIYIQHRRKLEEIYRNENILDNLTSIFSFQTISFPIRKDWRGGIYTLINPLIVPKEYQIFDANETLNTFIRNFLYDRLMAAENMVVDKQLWELLEPFTIKVYDENFNYLISTVPIAWRPFWKWTRWMIGLILTLITVGIVLLCVL